MSVVSRTWFSDDGWPAEAVAEFEKVMRSASRKPRGMPALVSAWDDGRGRQCWYDAHPGPDETLLRDRCRRIFGAREREAL